MNHFILATARKLTYVFAAGVILVAAFILTAQLLTPYFDKHLPDIEKTASGYLKTPVMIERVRLSWDQYQPVISLYNVTMLDEKNNKPVIKVRKISVFLSLFDSLRHLNLTPGGVLISGTYLNVHQNAAGEFSVQGFPSIGSTQPFQEETEFREVAGWLFQQSKIILRDIDVSYTDKLNKKREVTLYNLSMQNSGYEHVVVGKAVLHQDIPTEITMAISMQGSAENYEQLKGTAYLYISGFSLSQWLKGVNWQNWRIDTGIGSAKIWASWQGNALQRIQSIFQLYNIHLYSLTDKTTHAIDRLSGHVGWKKTGNEHIIAADDVLVNLPEHLWPSTSFYISALQNDDGTFAPQSINVGYIDISDVKPFLFSSSVVIPEAFKKALLGTEFDGQLQHANMTFAEGKVDAQHVNFNAQFSQVTVKEWQHYPGVKNLSGIINWGNNKGDITLSTHELEFTDKDVFSNPLKLDQVTGTVNVSYIGDDWLATTNNLQFFNKNLIGSITGKFVIPTNGEVESDINGSFSMAQAKNITQYLPQKIFSATLNKWLNVAFLQGKVVSGTAQLKGKLKNFPFDQNNGVFNITGTVDNVDFAFAPDWPILTNVGGKIVFEGSKMWVDVNKGWMMNIPIPRAHAEIPYLGDAKPNMLYVKADNIKSDMAAGMAFIHASPLEKTIGKMFKGVDIKGPLSLSLNLTMPLADPDKIHIEGLLDINNVNMDLVPWNLKVDKLSGQVNFTEDTTNSTPISGLLFNQPVTIQLKTAKSKTGGKPIVQADVTNHMNVMDLQNWLKVPLSKVANGSADLASTLDFAFDAPLVIQLKSNLQGITLDLPDQYAKKPNDRRDFTAEITVQEGKPLQAKLGYNNELGAALVFNKEKSEFHLVGADLRLGAGNPDWPKGDGIYITGTIPSLDWDKIKSYLAQSQSGKSALKGYKLKDINVLINKLDLLSQHLTDVQVEIIPDSSSYQIKLNSPQVRGTIEVPSELSPEAVIDAQLDMLTIQSSNDKQATTVDFKVMPGFLLSVRDMTYNNMRLGQVLVKTKHIANGQAVDMLQINSRNVELQASGSCVASGKIYKTNLKGTVNSQRVSDMLNDLGVDAHNFVAGNGHSNFNLSWNGPFYSPDVATLNGKFSIDLGSGRIVNIGDTNNAKMDLGKILSIFSLQSIPRRLSLDFSDIFQKGYSFDSMKGDYSLTNGNVFTSNMRIEGPVAKITINGRIGLSKKDVDFILNVTPYVTSSLPVAAGILTANPLVGLGAFAVNTMIGSKVVTYTYDVSGSWSDPTWQEITSAPTSKRMG